MTHNSMQLYIAEHMLLINAPSVISGPTTRPTYVLIWSTTDRHFTLTDEAGKLLFEGKAALIAPNVKRQLKTIDSNIFSLNIEPGHPYYLILSRLKFNQGLIPLNIQQFSSYSNLLELSFETDNFQQINTISNELTNLLLPFENQQNQRDERISTLLPLLESNNPLELASLSKKVGISQSHLSHLFSKEIGMSIKSYILWRRYRRAMLALQNGEKISTIAQLVGFYDHAQMSRTFLSLFGYAPSILKRPEFIRISSDFNEIQDHF
ncbi:helix-turn-helix transcriptional regulator [Acinetobacter baumannii]|uniref:helix-turn-helix transcriptional regulator n=1 Tax=Acinetobacter baumannii TaxID=470 RepID=UPI002934EDDA|nr:helix-turn-helix transcriptional regulator [Acinetobacter baumannii]WOE33953.1 helix-turn-helix transcriptional regulator [Acinetobacter baumannii]